MQTAQQGEPEALDTLLATLRPVLLGYFARRLPDDSVEDLAQVALLRIARALPRIVPDQAEGYVVTVARNLLRSAYARRAREARRRVGSPRRTMSRRARRPTRRRSTGSWRYSSAE